MIRDRIAQRKLELKRRVAEKEERKRETKRRAAARRLHGLIRLQSWYRGHRARARFKELWLVELDRRQREAEERAASKIQAAFRGSGMRAIVRRVIRRKRHLREMVAASRIGNTWRRDRERLLSNKAKLRENEDFFEKMRLDLLSDAAVTIQRQWRGHAQEVGRRLLAVLLIQRCVRRRRKRKRDSRRRARFSMSFHNRNMNSFGTVSSMSMRNRASSSSMSRKNSMATRKNSVMSRKNSVFFSDAASTAEEAKREPVYVLATSFATGPDSPNRVATVARDEDSPRNSRASELTPKAKQHNSPKTGSPSFNIASQQMGPLSSGKPATLNDHRIRASPVGSGRNLTRSTSEHSSPRGHDSSHSRHATSSAHRGGGHHPTPRVPHAYMRVSPEPKAHRESTASPIARAITPVSTPGGSACTSRKDSMPPSAYTSYKDLLSHCGASSNPSIVTPGCGSRSDSVVSTADGFHSSDPFAASLMGPSTEVPYVGSRVAPSAASSMGVSLVGSRADLAEAISMEVSMQVSQVGSRADISDAILMEASGQALQSNSNAESEVTSRQRARFDSRSTTDCGSLHDRNSSLLSSASSVASSPSNSPQASSRRFSPRDLSGQSHLMDSVAQLHPTPVPSEYPSQDVSMHASLRHLEHYLHGPLESIPSARASDVELPERRLSLTKSPSPPMRHGVKAYSQPTGFEATSPPACSSASTEKLQHLEAGYLELKGHPSLLEESSMEARGWGEDSADRSAASRRLYDSKPTLGIVHDSE